jgi:hypothetical protein
VDCRPVVGQIKAVVIVSCISISKAQYLTDDLYSLINIKINPI